MNNAKLHEIPPTFIIPNPSSKDQRYVIKYRIWNRDTNAFQLQREWTAKEMVDPAEKEKYCKARVKELRKFLAMGYQLGQKKDESEQATAPKNKYTILDAIAFFLKRKSKIKHLRDYKQKLDRFEAWLLENDYHKHSLKEITYEIIEEFVLDDLEDRSPRTINNYIDTISGVFNTHNKYNDDQVRNATRLIERDKNPTGKHIAYTEKQQKKILDFIRNSTFPHFELGVKTMFYSLARTDELFKLQRWMIGYKQSDQIWFPDYICKAGVEKNVTITEDLHQLFLKYKIYELPPDHFVFSKNFEPSKQPYKSKYAGNRYRERVLNPLGFNMLYTFYSWKHTGVCEYYRSGASIAAIQQQAGWTDPETFKVYLKSLGLFDNSEIKAKSPKLPS